MQNRVPYLTSITVYNKQEPYLVDDDTPLGVRHPVGGPVVVGPGEGSAGAAEDLVEVVPEPPVHPVVDQGVDTAVGHGQPVEQQVHVLGVPCLNICSTIKNSVYLVEISKQHKISPSDFKSILLYTYT